MVSLVQSVPFKLRSLSYWIIRPSPAWSSSGLFSIVVPIYNSEKYLTRCIESVQRQQFKNFEIILVEDKSTDASNKICNLFLKQYRNIKLIKHNKRYGVSVIKRD